MGMKFFYRNLTPRLQILNLDSGKSLHAIPHTLMEVLESDLKSVELKAKTHPAVGARLADIIQRDIPEPSPSIEPVPDTVASTPLPAPAPVPAIATPSISAPRRRSRDA